MSIEKGDELLDSILEEVKKLEKSIAETDYELRTFAKRPHSSSLTEQ